jgi:hypothetical protein
MIDVSFFPEDEYLIGLGKATFMVGWFESFLHDLPSIPDLPPDCTLDNLATKTTHEIGALIAARSRDVSDSADREWMKAYGDALVLVAAERKKFIHARPVTLPDGRGRLRRWTPDEDELITDEWLARFVQLVEGAVDSLRPFPRPFFRDDRDERPRSAG